jgi:hypothetical protein
MNKYASTESKLILYKGNVVCPRCDGNGLIFKAYVIPPSVTVYLCDECDALWEDGSAIRLNNFKDFTTYLREKGVAYIDANIESIDYDWYKKVQVNN